MQDIIPTPGPTPCIMGSVACIPTSTPTPAPNSGPEYTSPEPLIGYPDFQVSIDWNHVDKLMFAFDAIGTVADIVSWATILPQPEISVGAAIVGRVADVAGTGKGIYDLVANRNPSELVSQQFVETAVHTLEPRFESDIPYIGLGGDFVNLGGDLLPYTHVSFKWVNP